MVTFSKSKMNLKTTHDSKKNKNVTLNVFMLRNVIIPYKIVNLNIFSFIPQATVCFLLFFLNDLKMECLSFTDMFTILNCYSRARICSVSKRHSPFKTSSIIRRVYIGD